MARLTKKCARCGTEFSEKPSRFDARKHCSVDCMLAVLHAGLTTHGETVGKPSAEYLAWSAIKRRCLSPTSENYSRYGGRGITVCDTWRDSFEAFLADMGRRPSSAHSIDRINNNGDYEKSNCRWATRSEQQRNQSVTIFITFNGESRCLAEWADLLGIPDGTLYSRLRLGWSDEQTITGCKPESQRPRQAACRRGHPFDEVNTYTEKNGKRQCRTCQKARNPAAVAAYRARKRAQVQS